MGIRSMSLKRGNPRPRTAEGRWYAVGGNHERGKWGLCPQTTVNVPGAQEQPQNILAAIDQIRLMSDPPPHITMGLSNLSQGTGERSLINRIFLAMAISHGADSAIVDVLDDALVDVVATAEMLMNKQIYSDSFLKAYRGGAGGRH